MIGKIELTLWELEMIVSWCTLSLVVEQSQRDSSSETSALVRMFSSPSRCTRLKKVCTAYCTDVKGQATSTKREWLWWSNSVYLSPFTFITHRTCTVLIDAMAVSAAFSKSATFFICLSQINAPIVVYLVSLWGACHWNFQTFVITYNVKHEGTCVK